MTLCSLGAHLPGAGLANAECCRAPYSARVGVASTYDALCLILKLWGGKGAESTCWPSCSPHRIPRGCRVATRKVASGRKRQLVPLGR